MSVDEKSRLIELFIPYHGHKRGRELAENLLKKFGSFNGVISNTNLNHSDFAGIDRELVLRLDAIREAKADVFIEMLNDSPMDSATSLAAADFRSQHHHNDVYRFGCYFFSNGGFVGKSNVMCGDASIVHLYPREIAMEALDLEATDLVFVVGIPETAFDLKPQMIERILKCQSALKTLGIFTRRVITVNKSRVVYEFNPDEEFGLVQVKQIDTN